MRTREILLCLLLSVLLFASSASDLVADEANAAKRNPPGRPMLYEVDTKPKIFLLGTIHARDKRLLAFPPVVKQVLEDADALYTELDLSKAEPRTIARKLLLPDGESLESVLPAQIYGRVQAAFKRWVLPLEPSGQLKVWALAVQIQGLDAPRTSGAGMSMDVALFREAQKRGKAVGGLESVDEQVAVFDSLSGAQQQALLVQALDALDQRTETPGPAVEDLVRAYLSGRPRAVRSAMWAQFDFDDPFQRWFYRERLLEERNVRMVRRLLERAQSHPEKTMVVAAGAAHLAGTKGMLALLRGTGFRVRKINIEADLGAPWSLPPKPVRAKPERRYRRFGPFCIPVGCCPPLPKSHHELRRFR